MGDLAEGVRLKMREQGGWTSDAADEDGEEFQLRTARQYDARPTATSSASSTPNVISSKSIVKPSTSSSPPSPRPSTRPPVSSPPPSADRCRCPLASRSSVAVAGKPLRRRVDVAVWRCGVGHSQSSICFVPLLSAAAHHIESCFAR